MADNLSYQAGKAGSDESAFLLIRWTFTTLNHVPEFVYSHKHKLTPLVYR
jgi:hypothetical protein